MSKGSRQRQTNKRKFDDNFDRIFRGNKCQEQHQDPAQNQAAKDTPLKMDDVIVTSGKHGQVAVGCHGMNEAITQTGTSLES